MTMNDLVNYEAVYRTAPATPGLLISDHNPAVLNTQTVILRHLSTVTLEH